VVATLLLILAVGVGAFQWGAGRAHTVTAPTVTATSGAGTLAVTSTLATTTTAPSKPRLLGTLITRNLKPAGVTPADRVYNAVGQGSTTRPRFSARPGEQVRIKVVNRDDIVHSFTLDRAHKTVDVFAGTSETVTLKAPLKPGTYTFYCRWRALGMDGRLVVRGQPVRG
jgi:heme/copper-type cytochrome/quinol oxidase subunit 2